MRAGRIEPAQPGHQLLVPLNLCCGQAHLLVEPGQRVHAGQRLAHADDGHAVFSPAQAAVAGIGTAWLAQLDNFGPTPAARLVLHEPAECPLEHAAPEVFDWRKANADELRARLDEGGLTTFRMQVVSLRRWLTDTRNARARWLILNAAASQPHLWANHRLLTEHGDEVMHGLAILGRCTGAGEMMLAVDQRRIDDYGKTIEPSREHQIERVALHHKYPIGADAVLVSVLTGRERPIGGTTLDVGSAVIDAATCQAVYRWVACGQRSVGRVVSIWRGPGDGGNYWAPFGSSCSLLAHRPGATLIHGGPMTGLPCHDEAVLGPATNALLAMDVRPTNPPTPCIRCGWCLEYCPARLNVAALNDAYELGDLDWADRLKAQASVECGVCSYVCPARLPLAQRVKQLKRLLATRQSPLQADEEAR